MKAILFIAILLVSAYAQALPFVGVVEWDFNVDDLEYFAPWRAKPDLPQAQRKACAPFTEQTVIESTKYTRHAGRVLSQLVTGRSIDPVQVKVRGLFESADPQTRFVPLSLSAFLQDAGGFFECVSELGKVGMVGLTMSTGIPGEADLAKLNGLVTTVFRVFLKTNPRLTLLLAAGNHGMRIQDFSGAPQTLCREKLPNLLCVTYRNGIERAGEPVRVGGNYDNDGPNICSVAESSSFSTPKLARLLLKAERERGATPLLDYMKQKVFKKISGFTRESKPVEVWDF